MYDTAHPVKYLCDTASDVGFGRCLDGGRDIIVWRRGHCE